jgi:hypothetical protein
MRHQNCVQHEQLPLIFCQSEDVYNIIWLFVLLWYLISSQHVTYVDRVKSKNSVLF